LTLRKKKNTRKKQYPLALFFSPFSLFYAYFPYQRFLLFGFFFFPFPLFSKTITLKAAHVYCSKREILYTRFVSFVKPLFHFFSFLFFISFEKEVNLMPKAISIKPFYFRAETHL